jgi:hypothetical protein
MSILRFYLCKQRVNVCSGSGFFLKDEGISEIELVPAAGKPDGALVAIAIANHLQ